jgi:hypothetical protein
VARWVLALAHGALAVALIAVVVRERAPEAGLAALPCALVTLGLVMSWRWVRWLALAGALFACLLMLVFAMAILWPEEQVNRLLLGVGAAVVGEIVTFGVASRFPKWEWSHEEATRV